MLELRTWDWAAQLQFLGTEGEEETELRGEEQEGEAEEVGGETCEAGVVG